MSGWNLISRYISEQSRYERLDNFVQARQKYIENDQLNKIVKTTHNM